MFTRERFAVHCNDFTVSCFHPLRILRGIPIEWEARGLDIEVAY